MEQSHNNDNYTTCDNNNNNNNKRTWTNNTQGIQILKHHTNNTPTIKLNRKLQHTHLSDLLVTKPHGTPLVPWEHVVLSGSINAHTPLKFLHNVTPVR